MMRPSMNDRAPLPDPVRRRLLADAARYSIAAGVFGSGWPAIQDKNETIGIAFIGVGSRGSHLMRSHGFWPDSELKAAGYASPPQERIPGVAVRAVCDVYQRRLDEAVAACAKYGEHPAAHRDFRRVLDDKTVNAVLIATADVWHAPIAIAALQAGKDVYIEKCMTHSFGETKRLREVARASDRIVQVGHQNRHSTYHNLARSLVHDGVLGPVTVMQTAVARNTPSGAYLVDVPADATPERISWDLFVPPAPDGSRENVPFEPAQLFTWRRFWRYSTGIAGDLMSHEIDAADQILGLGIPDFVTASGGVYTWRDGRETPDVYSVIHEHRSKGVTFTYNATLASSFERKTTILGRDATLVLGLELAVYPDVASQKYSASLGSGKMSPGQPFIHFEGPTRDPKLTTSPTLAWAEGKGLTFTEFGGKKYDVTRLHLEEFHRCMRERKAPVCGVEEGYRVAVACHMGTRSYREGRPMRWDSAKEEIVPA